MSNSSVLLSMIRAVTCIALSTALPCLAFDQPVPPRPDAAASAAAPAKAKAKAKKAKAAKYETASRPPEVPMPGKVATETRDACFERLLDRFPWPEVPSPTNQRVIVKEVLRDAEPLPLHASGGAAVAFPNGPRTLGQLLQHLRSRLDRAGYPAPPVLGAGCNGFALILEGESVRADGSRIAFEQWNQSKGLGLIDILDKLFRGEPGFYRMIVIVASSEKPVEGGGPITADALRRLLTLGSSGLPVGMEGIPFDERYELYALVYEFEKTAASSPTQVVPAGRIPMQTHLRAAGLVATQ